LKREILFYKNVRSDPSRGLAFQKFEVNVLVNCPSLEEHFEQKLSKAMLEYKFLKAKRQEARKNHQLLLSHGNSTLKHLLDEAEDDC
jgi:hypothetical protein